MIRAYNEHGSYGARHVFENSGELAEVYARCNLAHQQDAAHHQLCQAVNSCKLGCRRLHPSEDVGHHAIAYVQGRCGRTLYILDSARECPVLSSIELRPDEDLWNPRVRETIQGDMQEMFGSDLRRPCGVFGLIWDDDA